MVENSWMYFVDEKPLRVLWKCPVCAQFLVNVAGAYYCWFCYQLGSLAEDGGDWELPYVDMQELD